ncbi:MAG: TetR/AcrR family transcriptional regulator [Desulfobulbaceae bacterium]|jgi:AcrR family transcriptional regulator|nr:TetR/AcrR family transcriptional regulator [Desulfobulbaceae bacterium]
MKTSLSESKKKKNLPAAQRQEVLLKAASEVFLEKGYAATSLDDIIGRAGGSRRSIYAQFGGKEGLFNALVTKIASQALAPMRQEIDKETDLREALFAYAESILSALFTPTVLDLSRLALADGARFPDLAKVYFASGPGSAVESLTRLLEAAKNRGEIQCLRCDITASQFVGALRDNLYLQVLLRLRPAPEQEERAALVTSVVEIFLHGILTARPKPQPMVM